MIVSIPTWLVDAGDDVQRHNVARLLQYMTACRKVVELCMPKWLQSSEPVVCGAAMNALKMWVSNNSMKELVELYPDTLVKVVVAVNDHGMDASFASLTMDILITLVQSPVGRTFLLKLEDRELYQFLLRLAEMMSKSEMALGQSVAKMFYDAWETFVMKMVLWYGDSVPTLAEDAPKVESFISSLFAKKEDENINPAAISPTEAKKLIRMFFTGIRVCLHSTSSSISGSALEFLSYFVECDPEWMNTFVHIPGFAMDMAKLGNSNHDVLCAVKMIETITRSSEGRESLAQLLMEDMACRLLMALDNKTQHGDAVIAQLVNKAWHNISSATSDTQWQLWLAQLQPKLLARNRHL
ncbi:hypothetical protein CYMTET_53246 [Cymbomonas tetramitiformis]|uniref:Uncharacterized protein n=1 Tax=Cymbomonas tetramitiformis TaxID=36881 RepID=A0AAE0BHA2_9CHLO|nr:hypothetical protein CYMTET_53246 [Cymbomonas tetramitiformis]